MTIIDRDQILSMIPHAGAMCLLDVALAWDENSVRCLSRRYRDKDNPLRRADGVLGAACGIEIAAQAMALHGRLIARKEGPPVPGYFASVRDVQLRTSSLDAIDGDLVIDAKRLMGDANGVVYHFILVAQGVELLSGRATVVFGVGA